MKHPEAVRLLVYLIQTNLNFVHKSMNNLLFSLKKLPEVNRMAVWSLCWCWIEILSDPTASVVIELWVYLPVLEKCLIGHLSYLGGIGKPEKFQVDLVSFGKFSLSDFVNSDFAWTWLRESVVTVYLWQIIPLTKAEVWTMKLCKQNHLNIKMWKLRPPIQKQMRLAKHYHLTTQ